MATITAALANSANALDVFQKALAVVQDNVSNSSTPGYATQQLNLEALPMDSASTAGGGVGTAGVSSARDSYADTAVELQQQKLGCYTAQAQATGRVQSFFDVTGNSGVSNALTNLFTAFSSWAAQPADPATGQAVLAAAGNVGTAINGLSTSLQHTSTQIGQQVDSTVTQINNLAAQIQQYNVSVKATGQSDAASQAQLQTNLESLSKLVNFTSLAQADGTVTILVGGGTPLVMGSNEYALSAGQSVSVQPAPLNPQSPPTSHVYDSQGNEITGDITSGQLGGLLDTQNRVIAGVIGDAQNAGSLNTLASNLADTVNTVLKSGTVSTALGAAAGTALFTYNNADATLAAGSLAVNPNITVAQLAPVDAAGVSNGNATALAAMANATSGQGTINGLSYPGYFASIASDVGQENQTATTNQTTQQQVTTQAQTLRDSISAVSLDAQASLVLQFQRAYESVARVLTVVNSLADSALNLIPQA
jgi:flagellar hook-associated protein 1 FlgK